MKADALVRAIEENTTAHYEEVAPLVPDFHFRRDDDLHWYSCGLVDIFFNGVSWAAFGDAEADARIDDAIGWFGARGLRFRWWLGPSSRPVDLGTRLVAHGLEHVFDAPGMTMDLDEPIDVPTLEGVAIERVRDDEGLREHLDVVAAAYGDVRPADDPWFHVYSQVGYGEDCPIRHYVARVDGAPVCASTAVLGAGVAGIYHVHTVPEARGRGIGSAMTLAPMAEARELGYDTAILHATAMGEPVYRKLGLVERCKIGVYSYRPAIIA